MGCQAYPDAARSERPGRDRLARELAALEPGTTTEVVRDALTERGRRLADAGEEKRRRIRALEDEVAWLQGRGAAPAALNYGDLFRDTLTKRRDLPLLYKGGDVARTNVRSAAMELAP